MMKYITVLFLFLTTITFAQVPQADELIVVHKISATQMSTLSPEEGAIIYNSDDDFLYAYNGSAWVSLEKVSSLVNNNDGTFTYTSENNTQTTFVGTDSQTSSEVDYDNTTSGLTATNVQAAIDELISASSDYQTIDVFELNADGKNLDLSLENDGEATQQVDLSALNITGDVTGTLASSTVEKIQNVEVSATAPTDGQVLTYNNTNSQWEPTTVEFPQILVDASRTSNYTAPTGNNFNALPYNTASTNVGGSYNTTSGTFTAPANGIYQVIVNNTYSTTSNSTARVSLRIIANGTRDMELTTSIDIFCSGFLANCANINQSRGNMNGLTIVELQANQTIQIQVGNRFQTMTPQTAAGQHKLKIIRLK